MKLGARVGPRVHVGLGAEVKSYNFTLELKLALELKLDVEFNLNLEFKVHLDSSCTRT